MAAHKNTSSLDGPVRHSSRRTKLYTCHPWKQRNKWRIIKHTNAEKKARAAIAAKHREEYHAALSASRQVLYDEAVKLHAQFGGHSIDYYLKDIVQETAATSSRKVSGWNVFLHQEAKRLNEGISLPITLKLLN
jgi:hypothetical protein